MNKETIERLPDLLRRLVDDYLAANKRISELECHVGRLRSQNVVLLQELIEASYAAQCGCNHPVCSQCKADGELSEVIEGAKMLINNTPAQSLNEIKAAAIEEAVESCKFNVAGDGNMHFEAVSISRLLDYAKQLRGEK